MKAWMPALLAGLSSLFRAPEGTRPKRNTVPDRNEILRARKQRRKTKGRKRR